MMSTRDEIMDRLDRLLENLPEKMSGNEESVAVAEALRPDLPHARAEIVDALRAYFERNHRFLMGTMLLGVAADLRLPEVFSIVPAVLASERAGTSSPSEWTPVMLERMRRYAERP